MIEPPPPPPLQADSSPSVMLAQPNTRPVWATVVGILSIALGGIGILSTLLNLLMVAAGASPDPSELLEMPQWYAAIFPWLNAANILTGGLLVGGGAAMLLRRRVARTLANVYALATFLQVIVGAIGISGSSIRPPTHGSATLPPGLTEMMSVFWIAGFALALVYPTFLLVWVNRKTIRDQIAAWGSTAPAPGGPSSLR